MMVRNFKDVLPTLRGTETGWRLEDLDRCWVVMTDEEGGDWFLYRDPGSPDAVAWCDEWSDNMAIFTYHEARRMERIVAAGNPSRVWIESLGDIVRREREMESL